MFKYITSSIAVSPIQICEFRKVLFIYIKYFLRLCPQKQFQINFNLLKTLKKY